MKASLQFIAIIALTLGVSACANNGPKASYEGYNMANQGSPASNTAATMVAPIAGRIR